MQRVSGVIQIQTKCYAYEVRGYRSGKGVILLLLLRFVIAYGVPYSATIYDLFCDPMWVIIIPDPSTRDIW
jgi:hypothetical protein